MSIFLKSVSKFSPGILFLTAFLLFDGVAFAQAVAPVAGQAPQPSFSEVLSRMLPMFALVFMIYYFMIVKPQQLKVKNQADLTSSLKKGDTVVTSAGIYGRISSIETDGVSIEISPNVKIKVELIHIARKVEPESSSNSGTGSVTKVK